MFTSTIIEKKNKKMKNANDQNFFNYVGGLDKGQYGI